MPTVVPPDYEITAVLIADHNVTYARCPSLMRGARHLCAVPLHVQARSMRARVTPSRVTPSRVTPSRVTPSRVTPSLMRGAVTCYPVTYARCHYMSKPARCALVLHRHVLPRHLCAVPLHRPDIVGPTSTLDLILLAPPARSSTTADIASRCDCRPTRCDCRPTPLTALQTDHI